MSKKILSVALALVLALSCFAVSAFAIGGMGYESEDANYTQTWELQTPVDNGNGTWSVDVKLTANYGVGAIQFLVEKTNVTGSVKLTGFAAKPIFDENGWEADVALSDSTGKVIINANPTVDGVYAIDCTNGVIIGTLTYTLGADSSAAINIKNDAKTATNPGGTLIAARMSDGNVVTGTAIVGQTATVGAQQVLGNAIVVEAPKLVVIGDYGIIDTDRGYVYGVDIYDAGEAVTDEFDVEGDGTLNIIDTDMGQGTGSKVQVLDSNSEVVEEYTLILFGDVNGDGFVDTGDSAEVENHDAGVYGETGEFEEFQIFAADINGDTMADTGDSAEIENHDAGTYASDTGLFSITEILGYVAAL